MMKSGIGLVYGKVIDIEGDSFTSKAGKEIKKLLVLVKPDEQSSPLELEGMGEIATKLEEEINILDVMVFQVGMFGREWKNQEGRTFRNTSLRIKEWTQFSETPQETQTVEPKTPF